MVLIFTTANGSCYVETKSLDGETNLKMRTTQADLYKRYTEERKDKEAFKDMEQYKYAHDLSDIKAYIECERPNGDIYKFRGDIRIEGYDEWVTINDDTKDGQKQ